MKEGLLKVCINFTNKKQEKWCTHSDSSFYNNGGRYMIYLLILNSYVSSGRIGPLTCFLQPSLSLAGVTALLQVAKPIFCLSPSTVLLHVTFGLPLFVFPSGAQVKAMCGFCWLFIHNTCPIQHHLHLLICLLMVQVLVRHLTSSFEINQYIFSNLHRHLCRNVSSFASYLFVIL